VVLRSGLGDGSGGAGFRWAKFVEGKGGGAFQRGIDER
jgi:hypothetical protein